MAGATATGSTMLSNAAKGTSPDAKAAGEMASPGADATGEMASFSPRPGAGATGGLGSVDDDERDAAIMGASGPYAFPGKVGLS